MVVVKIRRNNIQAELVKSFFKKCWGLRFSEKKNLLFVLTFPHRCKMSMLGVKFPIRMIFISSNFEVVDVLDAKPGLGVYAPKEKCKYILETPDKFKVEVGDKVAIIKEIGSYF